MHGMDLKLSPNSHEYARNMDENRVTVAEKKSTSETREARICHRLEQRNRRFNVSLKKQFPTFIVSLTKL